MPALEAQGQVNVNCPRIHNISLQMTRLGSARRETSSGGNSLCVKKACSMVVKIRRTLHASQRRMTRSNKLDPFEGKLLETPRRSEMFRRLEPHETFDFSWNSSSGTNQLPSARSVCNVCLPSNDVLGCQRLRLLVKVQMRRRSIPTDGNTLGGSKLTA